MTVDERIERLTGIVEALASTVVAHDNQIDGLIEVAAKQQKETAELKRQLQAYLTRLPPQ